MPEALLLDFDIYLDLAKNTLHLDQWKCDWDFGKCNTVLSSWKALSKVAKVTLHSPPFY